MRSGSRDPLRGALLHCIVRLWVLSSL